MNGKKRVNVYIDEEAYKKFKIQCFNHDTTISAELNKLIMTALEQTGKKNV